MRRHSSTLIAAFLLLSGVSVAHAADAALTLQEARRLAVQNHPNIRAAKYNAQAATEGITIARSSYLPQLNGDAVRSFAASSTRIGAPGGIGDPTVLDHGSLGLGVSQLLTDFGRTNALVRASRQEAVAANQRVNLTQETVMLDATRAFVDVLRAQALFKVAQDTLTTRQTLLDQVSTLRQSKLRSDLDLSLAQQGVADANLLMLKARTGIDDAYAELSEALGLSTAEHMPVEELSDFSPPPGDFNSVLAEAMANNPDLRAMEAELDAARQVATAAKKAGLPTIAAQGFAGVTPERDAAGVIRPHYAAGGLTLDVPLFTGGRLTAQAHRATLYADALDEQYTERKNILSRDVNIAYGNAQTAFQNISVTDQLRANAETTLELTSTGYKIGKNSIVDLNQAQLAATQAEIIHANALYDYRIQLALLDYQTGQLSEE